MLLGMIFIEGPGDQNYDDRGGEADAVSPLGDPMKRSELGDCRGSHQAQLPNVIEAGNELGFGPGHNSFPNRSLKIVERSACAEPYQHAQLG
jgi:hypothetical protein